jgi:hypothetical protein
MDRLTGNLKGVLIECLRALEAGASVEDCLARFPQHAGALRPYLALRASLLAIDAPQPPAAAYAAGRQALLERLASPAPARSRWEAAREALSSGWLRSPLARTAVAGAILFALAGSALGASAAAGVDQAHDVLSTLHVVPSSSQGAQHKNPNADQGASNRNDSSAGAPTAAEPGQQHANDHAANGSDNATRALGEQHRPCLPADLLDRVSVLRQLFSACATADNGTPAEGLTTPTPSGRPGEHGEPTNTGSDHRPITPPRPTDIHPQTGEQKSRQPTAVPTSHSTDVGEHSN